MNRLYLAAFALIFSQFSFSFPEMVRHGYVNCTVCHVAPNGGGLLTEYGRSLSREVLSTWGKENEGNFLYNSVTLPKWLNMGGDVRAVQTYLNTPAAVSGNFILMQADLEVGITIDKFSAMGTLGRQQLTGPATTFWDNLISRRHFVMYRPTEEFALRVGRFQTAYGLNVPDHILSTRRGLNWDQNTETYNIEASYIGEDNDFFATASLGRFDLPPTATANEKGLGVRGSHAFSGKYKVGAGYFYGTRPTANRHVFGPYAILGFTPRMFLLIEADFTYTLPLVGNLKWGFLNYARFDYEFIQGLHVYIAQEYTKSDFDTATSVGEAYTLGVQFFPRPHFEFVAAIQKQRSSTTAPFNDFGWLLLHYYL